MLGYSLIALLVLFAGFAAYVRLAPSDAIGLHVNPASVTSPNPRNSWLVADGGNAPPLMVPLPPEAVAVKLAAIASATPRTTLLGGGGLHTTWITRSKLMGYPDATSVMISPAPGGSQITVYARSRFGQGDGGVNRARVNSWISQLGA